MATYGGGTGLPTQRECLEVLGCYGNGKSSKFAEICAGVVLAGETSLSSAILAGDCGCELATNSADVVLSDRSFGERLFGLPYARLLMKRAAPRLVTAIFVRVPTRPG